MKVGEIRDLGTMLNVPAAFRQVVSQKFDLALILLGDSYLRACDLNEDITFGGPTLLFCGNGMAKKLPKLGQVKVVPLSNLEAKRFSCGLVGLKGELSHRLLKRLAGDMDFADDLNGLRRHEVLDSLNEAPTVVKNPKKKAVVKKDVDYVIGLPKNWSERSNKRKLRYFIPEWDDLVDRDYDFENDIHSGGSGNWGNEVYAHQMYAEPNYDGLLISKVVAEKSKSKKARINELGVHRFLRVPRSFPVMGDCGAFGYIEDDVPPYTTPEILDYYTRLDFDFGVSIDHLIVKSTIAQQRARYELTIQNAEEFLKEHRARGLDWVPMGAVQGWDPNSYREAARQYVNMGYKYIALGGLVRTSTKDVLRVLDEVHKVVPSNIDVHLFGLARIDAMKKFADLGVTSVDSASLLRRAWMGTGQNYITQHGVFYTAIRVPEAEKSFRAKRMVEEGRATIEDVRRLDKACMSELRRYDAGKSSVQAVLDVLAEYDHLITPDRPDSAELLRHTLEDQPWKQCGCAICKKDGIDVVIFRGNNRNRRRGFHNTYVFYRLLGQALDGEHISFRRVEKERSQLSLPGLVEGTSNAL